MIVVKIPPEKTANFEALKSEFESLQKALDKLATRINATTPFPRELFDQMREMQHRSIALMNQMTALGSESSE